ncbi:hypothetical protein M8C21_008609 [Ambrosia artemisiifolia]|uniref:Protein FATTY ACID EXPORT 1, chloroplastic n=1 Tax=Ambrosia artemisiifolia TaxID=4212 RepID=A0AAD5G2L2_AMBAR|nr:hypothetical protein M8C21_008609 [Ambrosia artemisiifolia]
MSSTISQLSCFSTLQNQFHLANRSPPNLVRLQLQTAINCSGSKSALKYTARASKSDNDLLEKPTSNVEEYVNGENVVEPTQHVDTEPKRAAKIHDFCFGIPYGGIVLGGGLVGFLFTRNFSTLMAGGLYGGALLALSMFSLKVWGQGHSSVPFILGQAGIAAALLWKNMQTYSLCCNAKLLCLCGALWWKPSKEEEICCCCSPILSNGHKSKYN